jgi:septum formation protein
LSFECQALNHGPKIYLASRSPRRQELLRQIGVEFDTVAADVDEQLRTGEPPGQFALRVARDKAYAALAKVHDRHIPVRPVLGADTCIALGDDVLGKPGDRADAERMLARLAGRNHTVLSAIHVVNGDTDHAALSATQVTFARLDRAQIRRYWESGEPRDKAGAYAIQGLGAAFVTHIDGSYSGVVGLPLYELAQILTRIGQPPL